MGKTSSLLCAILAFAPAVAALAGPAKLDAQHIATAAIEGRVRGESEAVNGAQVRVTNAATGYAIQTTASGGRFAVLGLPVGGPYLVVVEHLGYRPASRDSVFLALGDRLQIDFTLVPLAFALDTLHVVAAPTSLAHARIGVGTTISDSALHRLPTIDRDFYDFVRLTPQALVRQGEVGIAGGGVSTRFNSFLLDGVSERGLVGNFAGGTGQGAKAISIEAVKEYQVLLSPYDTRYGDFAGALINAVTRSGTNEMRGTAFVYGRNEQLARGTPHLTSSPYERLQFGFTLGGPIVCDRAHFFVAPEFQRLNAPAPGPYVGQSPESEVPIPVFEDDVRRFGDLLEQRGVQPGSSGRVRTGNPLVNLFARVDVAWPERNSRLVLWNNYSRAENIVFSRGPPTSALTAGSQSFPLSSTGFTSTVAKEVIAAQLYTHLRNGGLNEAVIAFRTQPSRTVPRVRAPSISVVVPHTNLTGTYLLEAGSHDVAHGIGVSQTTLEIADHLTLSLGGRHVAGMGARVELFQSEGRGLPGSYGSWHFSSLDSFERGEADRFRIVRELEGSRARPIGAHYSFYLSDEWRAAERLSIVSGLRVDLVDLGGRPAYNAAVDTLYGRRTTNVLAAHPHWSPRIGFDWEITGDGRARLRGGTGLFVGRPPIGWLSQPFRSTGNSVVTLQCGTGSTVGPVPEFVADYRNQPAACGDGDRVEEGPVNLAHPELRMAETFRASLAFDHALPWRMLMTVEGLYTKQRNDFVYVNLNLVGASATDRHGRVLYGGFAASGRARPDHKSDRFSEVIELRNHSKSYSFQGAARLEKRFSDRLEATASYAYSRAYDVQTAPSPFSALDNWRAGRVVSGRHETIRADRSTLDSPHHVSIAATYRAPWQRWVTDLALYYVGQSGLPFTYRAFGGVGMGDLNADGTNLNDPIYIPRVVSDTAEMRFENTADAAAQQAAFESLIERTDCLRRQRGRILARNSCRAPWVHISNASVRQTLPPLRGNLLTVQLDVFNVLNLLNDRWGHFREVAGAVPPLLQHVGQTAGSAATSQPIYRFDADRAHFSSDNLESAYQLQLALRYTF